VHLADVIGCNNMLMVYLLMPMDCTALLYMEMHHFHYVQSSLKFMSGAVAN